MHRIHWIDLTNTLANNIDTNTISKPRFHFGYPCYGDFTSFLYFLYVEKRHTTYTYKDESLYSGEYLKAKVLYPLLSGCYTLQNVL